MVLANISILPLLAQVLGSVVTESIVMAAFAEKLQNKKAHRVNSKYLLILQDNGLMLK